MKAEPSYFSNTNHQFLGYIINISCEAMKATFDELKDKLIDNVYESIDKVIEKHINVI